MLISFAAENHRSIRERVEVSLVAESRPTSESRVEHQVPGFDLTVVPAVALVGSNGSGKSNLLDALEYMISAVTFSQRSWAPRASPPRRAFETKDGPLEAASIYELSFAIDEAVFDYEFHVGAESILFEALHTTAAGPRSWTRLFERSTSGQGQVEIKYGRRLRGPRGAAEAATRPNSLFLSSAAQNNHPQLTEVAEWFSSRIRAVRPHENSGRGGYGTAISYLQGDERYRDRLRQFISSADLGIRGLSVKSVEMSEEEIATIKRIMSAVDPDRGQELSEQADFTVERTHLEHRGDVGNIPLDNESAGTQAWFEWAGPVLQALDNGQVLLADEVDAHLNTLLSSEIVALFQKGETNSQRGQLLFNVQNPGVISASGLGRDQVWVVEKDEHGATRITPVSDYTNSRRWEPGQAYQHGRFGGLPVVDYDALAAAALAPDEEG